MRLRRPRTMEFCRRWGIAGWVRDAPYPGDYPQDCGHLDATAGEQDVKDHTRNVLRKRKGSFDGYAPLLVEECRTHPA